MLNLSGKGTTPSTLFFFLLLLFIYLFCFVLFLLCVSVWRELCFVSSCLCIFLREQLLYLFYGNQSFNSTFDVFYFLFFYFVVCERVHLESIVFFLVSCVDLTAIVFGLHVVDGSWRMVIGI